MVRGTRASGGGAPRTTTIRDVAAAAGVSTATVSYVLNETPGQTITPATRERVQAAARTLGYVPHRVARTLREGFARVVLANVGELGMGSSLASLLVGLREELRRHDYALIVTTEPGGVPREVVHAVAPRAVLDLTRVTTEAQADVVSGAVAGTHAGFAFHTLTQLRHLAERGHRRIAFVTPGDEDGTLSSTRVGHVSSAAAELGLAPLTVVRLERSEAERAGTIRHLVETVTAVATFDDDVALAVLATMAGLGYRPPRDLAVIGFGDSRYGELWRPALTTVRIDAAAYGRRAARVALGLEVGPWSESPSEVVVRETT